ncbi:MAG TPA: patatin [Desulfobacterales bacterium]|nr:patatin [Desulfobacterales bacterium]
MKRILTIDGGGIKGVFPASFLATIEDSIENRVANYFDLIVGTSTGGIIALGLGLGFSAKEIMDFYEKSGPDIFAGNRLLRFLRSFGFSKYSQKPLREALTSIFGERKLGESTRRLVVPSLNLETGEVHIYKTSHHARFERDYKEKAVDVALATAAAPTYFPTHRSAAGTPLIDGGLWANNPLGLAVVEAIGVLGWPRDSLKVLSIGCTTEPLNVGLGRIFPFGLGYWGMKIVAVFMTAQSSSSLGTAQVLAGYENVFRIDLPVPKGRFGLDDVREIPSLRGLGNTEARKAIPSLRPIFFTTPAEEFIPYRKLVNNRQK